MSNTARNHHYLPQCYLKGFAKSPSKKSQLHVFDLKTGKSFCTCPRNVGAVRDFNTVELEGHAPDVIEKIFSQFETEAAKVLDQIRARHEMPKDADFNIFMNLVAHLAIRNPYVRKSINKFQTDIIELISDLTLATKERYESTISQMKESGVDVNDSITYEDVKNFHDGKEYTIEIANIKNIELEMTGIDAVLPTLADRSWSVVQADERSGYFISSDHPVSLIWTDPKLQGGFYPPGHGMRSTELVFPAIKEMAIIGTFEGEDRIVKANERLVASVNSRTFAFAGKHVYSSRPAFKLLDQKGNVRTISDITNIV
ncbi:DUF4238 domain-containing protein [Geobacter sp. AOG1]|uniref:DUF4238 domain-containing protein n=1 Tax=Geobacter sp. AOG1 TaxID=1566346 RepID=UPI001CC62CF0|nr:DUF4238 domain-containing protein [Geobacter sp. AOG1]GFE58957.1 hypothetical protein AOG1_28370 [Geobacter sp. AOG1]